MVNAFSYTRKVPNTSIGAGEVLKCLLQTFLTISIGMLKTTHTCMVKTPKKALLHHIFITHSTIVLTRLFSTVKCWHIRQQSTRYYHLVHSRKLQKAILIYIQFVSVIGVARFRANNHFSHSLRRTLGQWQRHI